MTDNPFVPGDDKVSPAITGGLQLPADPMAYHSTPSTLRSIQPATPAFTPLRRTGFPR